MSFEESVSSVSREDWNACAGTENPFVSHQFLTVLEKSGCVGEGTGWHPMPLLLRAEGELLGAAPCYLKLHSKGEYIFDYHWADAYHRLLPPGHNYYPKLQVAVPFTPVPGPRLLIRQDLAADVRQEVGSRLVEELKAEVHRREYSSAHITFCTEQESDLAARSSTYLPRVGEQYHWFNEGYESFDQFLSELTSRKRKNIRKERRKANAHPVTIHTVTGEQLTEEQCKAFFRMYEFTSLQKWGSPYLNYRFFRLLAQELGERMVLFLVESEETGRWVAGAWNLRGDNALFGRNWGCLEHYDLLHFEVCYYRAVDFAIEHGLERVEAGAQGMHKIQRGYRPQPVHSVHHIASTEFSKAIANYLRSERMETEYRLEALTSLEPFKQ